MSKRESLYHKYPDYRVELEANPARVQVRFESELIADSERTLLVKETRHEAVVYFPREDVRFDLLERTEHESFCPFKGVASYWTLRAAGRAEDNVVWSYEDPFDEVTGLKDYVSFYTDRVEMRDGA
jgi:uncharacterized protein (DUF427 family)